MRGLNVIADYAAATASPLTALQTNLRANHEQMRLGILTLYAYAAAGLLVVEGFKGLVETLGKHEVAVARLAQSLHNAGLPDTVRELYDYATARQSALGVDRDATLALASQLIQQRYGIKNLKEYIEILQSAQAEGIGRAGKGTDPGQLLTSITTFIQSGRTQGLQKFGIDIAEVKRSADQVENIFKQLRQHAGGDLQLISGTIGGDFAKAMLEWKSLIQDIGDTFAPVLRFIIEAFRAITREISSEVHLIRSLAHLVGIGTATEDVATRAASQTAVTDTWDEIEKHTRETAKNTKKVADSLVTMTLGAAGAIVKETATIRNINQAIKVGG